jgi:hypothetical protein
MFYFGETNVPGAPGNLLAGGPSFDINRRPGALGGRSGEQLKRLYEGGTQQNKQLNEELIERGIMPKGGPQLPLVQNGMFGGGLGNVGGMQMAQIKPTYSDTNRSPGGLGGRSREQLIEMFGGGLGNVGNMQMAQIKPAYPAGF